MIDDYSEVTATLQKRVAKLSDELSRKRWGSSIKIAIGIAKDMANLIAWIVQTKLKLKRQ